MDTQIGLETHATFRECLDECIRLLREFADGLECQRQFTDHRMLETLELPSDLGEGGVSLLMLLINVDERVPKIRPMSDTNVDEIGSLVRYFVWTEEGNIYIFYAISTIYIYADNICTIERKIQLPTNNTITSRREKSGKQASKRTNTSSGVSEIYVYDYER